MDTLNNFTSTGAKLLHHPDAIESFRKRNRGTPVSVQIAPTSRCNLNCVFCSNAHRKHHEDLDYKDLWMAILELKSLGAKTIEWTGGGDPTMYEYINECIDLVSGMGFKQGFITNGLILSSSLTRESLNRLHWIRISMNCLDYVDSVVLPPIDGTLGFSYVMNVRTDNEVLANLHEHVKKYRPAYVRIVPDCQVSDKEQVKNNRKYSKMVSKWGSPYFYQAKTFRRPERCWWCYFKPFILHDGWIYPCSSVVLNPGSDKTFHEKYRWARMEKVHDLYRKPLKAYNPKDCSHCVFSGQNEMLDSLKNPTGMEDFV